MSIASEITRLQGAKAALKTKLNSINKSTDQITDETLDEYGDYVDTVGTNITTAITTLETDLSGDSIYKMIAVGKGINVTLNDTEEESLDDFKILGKTVQNGTPSPTSPIDIENVWGKNLAYPNWASDFVTRINDTSKAKLETYDSKRCLYWFATAGYQEYDTKYLFRTNWKSNTQYTISFQIYGSTIASNFAVKYTDGTSQEPSAITKNTWNTLTLTTTANKTVKYLYVIYDQGYNYIDLDTVQIEEGITATTYETGNSVKIKKVNGTYSAHSEEIYNFPIGDLPLMGGDRIDAYGVHHVKGQYYLNGNSNETWSCMEVMSSYGKVIMRYTTSIDNIKGSGAKIGLCNYFIGDTGVWSNNTDNGFYFNAENKTNFAINLSTIGATSSSSTSTCLSLFKTWLSSHPLVIEYELATPTVTPLTSAQQTVFDEILQDGTYEVVTTYTSEGNLAPDMEINYHKDLQPRLTNIVDEVTNILQ